MIIALLGLLAVGYVLQLLGVLLSDAALVIGGAALGLLTETWLLSRRAPWPAAWARRSCTTPSVNCCGTGCSCGGLVRLDALRPGPYAALLLRGGARMLGDALPVPGRGRDWCAAAARCRSSRATSTPPRCA